MRRRVLSPIYIPRSDLSPGYRARHPAQACCHSLYVDCTCAISAGVPCMICGCMAGARLTKPHPPSLYWFRPIDPPVSIDDVDVIILHTRSLCDTLLYCACSVLYARQGKWARVAISMCSGYAFLYQYSTESAIAYRCLAMGSVCLIIAIVCSRCDYCLFSLTHFFPLQAPAPQTQAWPYNSVLCNYHLSASFLPQLLFALHIAVVALALSWSSNVIIFRHQPHSSSAI